jgi:hypothetical protein
VPKGRTVAFVQFSDGLGLREDGIRVAEDSAATGIEQQLLDKKREGGCLPAGDSEGE